MSTQPRVASLATIAVLIIVTSAPATAAPGDLDWSASYDGPAARKDRAFAIAAHPDDARVYVTGESRGDGLDYATIAYDGLTGDELWVARYEGPGQQDTASAIAVAPDGQTVVVTGSSWEFSDDADWATVAYDADTGDELWVRRMNLGATGHDHGRDVLIHGDRVLVREPQAVALRALGESAQVAAAVQQVVDELAAGGLFLAHGVPLGPFVALGERVEGLRGGGQHVVHGGAAPGGPVRPGGCHVGADQGSQPDPGLGGLFALGTARSQFLPGQPAPGRRGVGEYAGVSLQIRLVLQMPLGRVPSRHAAPPDRMRR